MSSPPLSFDRVASEYERTRSLPPEVGDAVAKHIAAMADGGWILDAGCGTGRFTRPLARHHSRVVGADVSGEMLAELRTRQAGHPEPLLVSADLRSLPFPDAQFAVVLAVHVLHLITDWREAFAEMWRVLSLDGALLLGYENRSASVVRDFYMTEGRKRGLLPEAPGTRDTRGVLIPFAKERFGITQAEDISPDEWHWTNRVSVGQLLADLDARLYSSQWEIAEAAHAELMALTRANARATFGDDYEKAQETIEIRFVLFVLRKTGIENRKHTPVPAP